MSKLSSFAKLLLWFWNHSETFLQVLDSLQAKIPLVVDALRWSADGLDRFGALESQAVSTLNDAERPLASIPLPGISSLGFYDALSDALAKVHVHMIPPDSNTKNEINKLRVPTVTALSSNPQLGAVAATWHERARELYGKINAPNNPVAKSAQALRDIATLLESTQDS